MSPWFWKNCFLCRQLKVFPWRHWGINWQPVKDAVHCRFCYCMKVREGGCRDVRRTASLAHSQRYCSQLHEQRYWRKKYQQVYLQMQNKLGESCKDKSCCTWTTQPAATIPGHPLMLSLQHPRVQHHAPSLCSGDIFAHSNSPKVIHPHARFCVLEVFPLIFSSLATLQD